MNCLVAVGDEVIKLTKGELGLVLEACNLFVIDVKRRINLFNNEQMMENSMYIDYINDIKAVITKLNIGD